MREIEKKTIIYEKITFNGADSLNDTELISIILGKGEATDTAIERAKVIIEKISKIEKLSEATIKNLVSDRSFTKKEKCIIQALFEITKRVSFDHNEKIEIIRNSKDVLALLGSVIGKIDHEEVWIICTNLSGRVIDKFMISKGGTSSSIIDIKIVLKRVINTLADSVIVVHNHPSGDLNPSLEDLKITEDIKNALSFFDILLSDHIIISGNNFYSLRENNFI